MPQADGTVTTLPGTGNSDGTFTIPNVPAGSYWLQMSFSGKASWSGPNQFYWTSSSTIDCGGDGLGRPNTTSVSAIYLNWNLTNLTSWSNENYDKVDAYAPNANSWFNPDAVTQTDGATTFVDPDQQIQMTQVDPTQGDIAYIDQDGYTFTENATVWSVMSTAAIPSTFSIVNPGDIGNITAAMVPNSSSITMDMNVDFPSYTQALSNANPSLSVQNYDGWVQLQPFVTDRSTPNWNTVWLGEVWNNNNTVPTTPTDLGTLNLGTQYPSTWPLTSSFEESGTDTLQLSGSANPTTIEVEIGHTGPNTPTASQPDEPVMSAVQNPTINGGSFSNPPAISSGPINLAWSAPNALAPYGYWVALYTIDAPSGSIANEVDFYTAQPALTIPSQSLPTGTYLFQVEAMADSLAKIETAPFHYGLTQAWADALSGFVSYTSTATSNSFMPTQEDALKAKSYAKRNASAKRPSPKTRKAALDAKVPAAAVK
jgi:hypothetical protein